MKKLFSASLALITGIITMLSSMPSSVNAAESNIPAFPGAVGGGKYATGGRGGEIYHVTNLNDSGAGSFRDAVSQSNRIVVFDVSGTIELKSNVVCSSNITIAGQTAPGGSGITLKNYKFGMGGDNIIVRYISSRPGPYNATSSGNDAWGGAKGSNSMVDHCSLGWTTDEQWGLYSNNDHYTVQYSVVGPANSWGGHVKGVHGFGLMMGRSNLTFDHNLICHNVSRNFRGKVVGTETADFTNNVIYDWGYQTAYGTIGHVNYVNNTLKAGNSTAGGYHYVQVQSSDNFKLYLSGNRILNKDDSYRNSEDDNWSAIQYKHSDKNRSNTESTEPFTIMSDGENISSVLTCESAADSYEHVISFAGNGISPEKRTKTDQQCAEETKTGTGSCSGTDAYDSSQSALSKYNIQCGVTYEYPEAVLEKTIKDSDNDGMPDEWELARGLDPNDPNDYKGDYCGQGYMNIEYYINDLTIDSFPEGIVELSPETSVSEPISAFETIEAENFDSQLGVKTEDCSEGGQNVGYIENGDYIMFKNIDFDDGALSFKARIAGGQDGAAIEIYTDSTDGSPAGKCSIQKTGGWQDWSDVSCNISRISGKHELYLKFTGDEGFLFNINNFVFSRKAAALDGNLIKNLMVNDSENISGWKISQNFSNGSAVFGDRDFTAVNLPDELCNTECINTACNSKYFADNCGQFTAGDDISVYIAIDTRVNPVPEWLSQWDKTSLSVSSSNDVTFSVYKKNFSSGETVTLGSNGQSANCVNYFVMAAAKQDSVSGDVNADGQFNIIDITMLKKWLVSAEPLAAPQAADLSGDSKTDIYDLCIMKNMLIAK